MSASEFTKVMLDYVHAVLKPVGFSKSGNSFSAQRNNDVVWVVQLQKSQKSTTDVLIATVNLGVFSHLLATRLGRDSKEPSVWDCHWQERLGFLTPERSDRWWEVQTIEEAQRSGEELSGLLTKYGLPTFEVLSSTAALQELWSSGRSPGLTEVQRQRYLKAIERISST